MARNAASRACAITFNILFTEEFRDFCIKS